MKLLLAGCVAVASASDVFSPARASDIDPAHREEMASKLVSFSTAYLGEIRDAGAEERLERLPGFVMKTLEEHGGFVTDMVAKYRPGMLGKWLARANMLTKLHGQSGGGRRLTTGQCFETHKDDWACTLDSCWCDQATGDSQSSEDSLATDDGSEDPCTSDSEYAAYACDVSMLQLGCQVDNDADCVVDCEGAGCLDAADDWAATNFVNVSDVAIEMDEALCPSWPLNCCGDENCTTYGTDDATCATTPLQCAAPATSSSTATACDGYVTTRATQDLIDDERVALYNASNASASDCSFRLGEALNPDSAASIVGPRILGLLLPALLLLT